MEARFRDVLRSAFPGQEHRFFSPMSIGNTPESADEGARLVLDGTKTLTSSAFWEYPDGKIPFVGALSVLVDGSKRARAIVETERVLVMPFGEATAEMAYAYGEGERTLGWFREVMGDWYRTSAEQNGQSFSDETPLIWEWFRVERLL